MFLSLLHHRFPRGWRWTSWPDSIHTQASVESFVVPFLETGRRIGVTYCPLPAGNSYFPRTGVAVFGSVSNLEMDGLARVHKQSLCHQLTKCRCAQALNATYLERKRFQWIDPFSKRKETLMHPHIRHLQAVQKRDWVPQCMAQSNHLAHCVRINRRGQQNRKGKTTVVSKPKAHNLLVLIEMASLG
jgi:hypothetical protein